MKTIFTTAVQYSARLAAAMRRSDLPQERKECYAQALRAWGGLYEPLSRPFTRPWQPGLPPQAKSFAFSHQAWDRRLEALKARYSLAAKLLCAKGIYCRDLSFTGAANLNVRCLADTAPLGARSLRIAIDNTDLIVRPRGNDRLAGCRRRRRGASSQFGILRGEDRGYRQASPPSLIWQSSQ